jgi:hypothetical protein
VTGLRAQRASHHRRILSRTVAGLPAFTVTDRIVGVWCFRRALPIFVKLSTSRCSPEASVLTSVLKPKALIVVMPAAARAAARGRWRLGAQQARIGEPYPRSLTLVWLRGRTSPQSSIGPARPLPPTNFPFQASAGARAPSGAAPAPQLRQTSASAAGAVDGWGQEASGHGARPGSSEYEISGLSAYASNPAGPGGRRLRRVRAVGCTSSVHREPSTVRPAYTAAANRLQDPPKAQYLRQIYMVAPIFDGPSILERSFSGADTGQKNFGRVGLRRTKTNRRETSDGHGQLGGLAGEP